jgi:hypothetical protein
MKLQLNRPFLALFLAGFGWVVLAAADVGQHTAPWLVWAPAEDVGGCCGADGSDHSAWSQEKCTCGLCACSAECHGERCDCPKPCSCGKCGCRRENDSVTLVDSDQSTSAPSDRITDRDRTIPPANDRIRWAGCDGPISSTTRR